MIDLVEYGRLLSSTKLFVMHENLRMNGYGLMGLIKYLVKGLPTNPLRHLHWAWLPFWEHSVFRPHGSVAQETKFTLTALPKPLLQPNL